MFAGIAAIDGNRVRFAFQGWRSLMAMKMLRKRVAEVLRAAWKNPERELTAIQKMWVGLFWQVMDGVGKDREKK